MLQEFAESAKALTKNPLGIIGLFIVLVYGFACIVLGVGAQHLESAEKLPLVWFLVLFPVLILAAFYRLVTNHHKKLYAPSDYKDEKHFFSPLTDEQRAERLEREVKRITDQENTTEQTSNDKATSSTIRASYADAERLAFLAIEQEIGRPFQKYVEIKSNNRSQQFDGALVTDTEAHLIEVKYFTRPAFKREFLEAIIHRASGFIWQKTFDEEKERDKIILWIALVVNFDKSALPAFEAKVNEAISSELFDVRLRFYHIDDLKSKYG